MNVIQETIINPDTFSADFISCCKNNQVEALTYFVNHPLFIEKNNTEHLTYLGAGSACESGNLELLTYFITNSITSPLLTLHSRNLLLIISCGNNHLPLVSYLLTSDEVNPKPEIHTLPDSLDLIKGNYHLDTLSAAAQEGYLEIIQYLLTAPELINKADLAYNHQAVYRHAIHSRTKNKLEIIDYILSSSDLKDHANPYQFDFLNIYNVQMPMYYDLSLVQYLISHHNVDEKIIEFCSDDLKHEVMATFKRKNLFDKIHTQLPITNNHITKHKI
jgi:hypothetical protein